LNALEEKVQNEMAAAGIISFARFMELALYCPVYGYYERERDTIGRRGDYYTNVSVGSRFGEMLAFQFAAWLDELRPRRKAAGAKALQLVEAGAHDGRLAADILKWLQEHRRDLFAGVEYWIIEPSARRQEWQQQALRAFAPKVCWLGELPRSAAIGGVIFCNELLDALPLHRLGWDATQRVWFEWGVTVRKGRFAWQRMPEAAFTARRPEPGVLALPPELLDVLPDGFTVEVCPAAEDWWRRAANTLERGKLVTIDYGLSEEELFLPERPGGTLRAYHRHHASGDVLANVGEQDITAHVNFAALQKVGEAAGLKTEAFLRQEQFLTRIAEKIWQSPALFGKWTSAQTRQFQTLTHPQHLGRPFRVLIQSR
jgi:SAM-dependent MidA family methyltransferase